MVDLEKTIEFVTEEQNFNLFAVIALTSGIYGRTTERSAPFFSAIARGVSYLAAGALSINLVVNEPAHETVLFPPDENGSF